MALYIACAVLVAFALLIFTTIIIVVLAERAPKLEFDPDDDQRKAIAEEIEKAQAAKEVHTPSLEEKQS
jgi:hypothetical protein